MAGGSHGHGHDVFILFVVEKTRRITPNTGTQETRTGFVSNSIEEDDGVFLNLSVKVHKEEKKTAKGGSTNYTPRAPLHSQTDLKARLAAEER